jgi:hypothetical protein
MVNFLRDIHQGIFKVGFSESFSGLHMQLSEEPTLNTYFPIGA